MATLKDTSALSALNEQDYINKLYDSNTETTKKLLQDNYTQNTGVLDNEKQSVQDQTNTNIERTNVEAQQAQNAYSGPKLSVGASAQEALSRGNARQANTTSLNQKQAEADAEIERQRQLLGSQYAAAIKKAQADNDMERAQQLYDAAKDEEAKLLSLRTSASSLMAEHGDTTIRDSLLNGEMPTPDYSGETWEQVLKNESAINDIYNNMLESQKLDLQTEQEKALSDLYAKQAQQRAQTDQKLNQEYVDALQKAKNYAEVQSAYGQGSGAAAAARIAQDTELQKELTRLRGVQMGADAGYGMDRLALYGTYGDKLADATGDVNAQRAEALLKAAEDEEEKLYNTQLTIGQELAKEGDYSVLGPLYGLTEEQIAALMPRGDGGGSSSSGKKRGGYDVEGAINAAVAAGTSQSSTKANVNKIINAAASSGVISKSEAQAIKAQYRGQVY